MQLPALHGLRAGCRQLGRSYGLEISRCFASSSSEQLAAIKSLREASGAPMAEVRAALVQANWQMDDAMQELRNKGVAASSKKAARNAAQGLIGLATDTESAALIEVNSETDFVARNDKFIDVVGQVAAAALALEPDRPDGHLKVEQLQQAQVRSGTSVAALVENVASVVREKMALRRGFRLTVPGGAVGSYLHGSPAPGVGRMGALVGLACHKAALDDGVKEAARKLGDQLAMHIVAMRPPFLDRQSVPETTRQAEAVMLHKQARESGKPDAVIEKMVLGRLNKFYQESCLVEQTYVVDDTKRVQQVLDEFSKGFGCELHITHFIRLQCGEGLETDLDAMGVATEMADVASKY